MIKKITFVAIAIFLVAVVTYTAWYSYNRNQRLALVEKCNDTLANPAKPMMTTGPDGKPAPLYSINGCVSTVVPPSLWNILTGHMIFDAVPQRMKINPYSFTNILLGQYTLGPTDIRCDQSATTTDCSQFATPLTGSETMQRAIAKLLSDMKNVMPHFVDATRVHSQALTPEESEIKDRVVELLIAKNPGGSEDYYSAIWLNAIGKRYILISQPSAESSHDEIIDSQTGTVTPISGEVRYYLTSEGRDVALYIDYTSVHIYTLDQPDVVLVKGSQLIDNETYHSGTSDAYLSPVQTHTTHSMTISVFDSSQIVPNPESQPNAIQTMYKKLRDIVLTF